MTPPPDKKPASGFSTVSDLARRYGVSEKHIRRDIKAKQLIAHYFGDAVRISDPDRDAYERAKRRP